MGDDVVAQLKNGGPVSESVQTGTEGHFKRPLLVYFKPHNDTKTLTVKISKPATKNKTKGKGKAGPLQAWSGLEGSRKLRFPDFMTTAQDGW
jgi:hypothetical protein